MLQSEYVNLDLELCDLIGYELAIEKRFHDTMRYHCSDCRKFGDRSLNDELNKLSRELSYVTERRKVVEDRINTIEYATEGVEEFNDWW